MEKEKIKKENKASHTKGIKPKVSPQFRKLLDKVVKNYDEALRKLAEL